MYPDRTLGFFSLPSFSSFTLPAIDWAGIAKVGTGVALQLAQVKAQTDLAKAQAKVDAAKQEAAQRAAEQAAAIAAAQSPRVVVPTTAPQVGVQWTGGAAPASIFPRSNLLTPSWVVPAALAAAGVAVLLIATNRR